MRSQEDCVHSLLAAGPGYQITLCSCGRVHFSLGDTTLRLDPQQLDALASGLTTASERMHREATPTPQWLS